MHRLADYLTFSRIIASLNLIFIPFDGWTRAVIFVAAFSTDALDGIAARHFPRPPDKPEPPWKRYGADRFDMTADTLLAIGGLAQITYGFNRSFTILVIVTAAAGTFALFGGAEVLRTGLASTIFGTAFRWFYVGGQFALIFLFLINIDGINTVYAAIATVVAIGLTAYVKRDRLIDDRRQKQ